MQIARDAAIPTALEQYRGIRSGVAAAVAHQLIDLISADSNDTLYAIGESVAAERSSYGMRLCDGSYVSAGARVTRGGDLLRGSAELFRHYPSGDPRKPCSDPIR